MRLPCAPRAPAGRSRARRPPGLPRRARPRATRRPPRAGTRDPGGRPRARHATGSRSCVRHPSRRNCRCPEGFAGGSANPPRPTTISPADAHNLERLRQLWSRQHPRRPRAGDEAGCAPVGRVVPDAAPRVRDADQAEALVPGARARRRVRRARPRLGGREGAVRDRRGRRPRGDRAARHEPLDRDQPVRAARRGRPGLLRPHLLPRARRRRGCAAAVRAAARGDEGGGGRRARALRPRRQGEALPDPRDGRRARDGDALRARGREGPRGDRRRGARPRR